MEGNLVPFLAAIINHCTVPASAEDMKALENHNQGGCPSIFGELQLDEIRR